MRSTTEIKQSGKTRLSISADDLDRFFTLAVVMPRERFSQAVSGRIQSHLEHVYGMRADEVQFTREAGGGSPAQIYFMFRRANRAAAAEFEPETLEQAVEQLSLTWDENLYTALESSFDKSAARRLFAVYATGFSERYKSATSVGAAIEDIRHLETLSAARPIALAITPGSSGSHDLRIYKRGHGLILGTILPILENAGFAAEDESSFYLGEHETPLAAVHNLRVRPRSGQAIHSDLRTVQALNDLSLVFNDKEENDRLNALFFEASLTASQVSVLRALIRYLWQVRAVPSRSSAADALVSNPELARLIFECFDARFNPRGAGTREEHYSELKSRFLAGLREVRQLAHDRVLRSAINLVESIVRTNFYSPRRGNPVSFKIECSKVSQMPRPRPLFELFVSGKDLEGVHLRGGRIARGGIRWSERPDDYRTEVLGLMKTQTVKNAIIVPVGAKGGFVVKNLSGIASQDRPLVQDAYGVFVRSLLQLTDNRIDGAVVRPPDIICHDEADPYFVVAADKGTASFSDIANRIAVDEFAFWLGDAFASGGSAGYDHKKLGITAKGAWEAIRRHFHQFGIDPERAPFSLVGIGDMAGDVFGNGLLLCRCGRLIGAFNHSHIFLDPDPDIAASYAERERLFQMPGSGWPDYSKDIISPGGGVFGRNDKEISLSAEARRALGTDAECLSGPELVQAILCAPVDLIWNGGIGTYVKASYESQASVNDPLNDEVRVDAGQLRAKIAAEGGNLGFTQQARIEFSRLGGRINTDAIDNSGGVNLSDLEVNWKILLSAPLARGELTRRERDEILADCAAEAAKRVIERNHWQSLALSLGERRSRVSLKPYTELMAHFERTRQLDRTLEQLPRDADLALLAESRAGLSRPELAVLLAYAKMEAAEQTLAFDIFDLAGAKGYLFSYFPKHISERFAQDILDHPLRREIVAAQLANRLVERLGSTFLYRATPAEPSAVLSAYLAAEQILGLPELVNGLQALDSPETVDGYLCALSALGRAAENAVRWLSESNFTAQENIEREAGRYQAAFNVLSINLGSILQGPDLLLWTDTTESLITQGLSAEQAAAIGALSYTSILLDVCRTAFSARREALPVARLFAKLSADFRISSLLMVTRQLEPKDRWEEQALKTLAREIRQSLRSIVSSALDNADDVVSDPLEAFLGRRARETAVLRGALSEAEVHELTLPRLAVLASMLRTIAGEGR